MAEARTQRRLAAILAADIAGYSRLMGVDEAGTLAALKEIWTHHFGPIVTNYRGRIVKMMGDGALVEFASAVDAVECAVEVQKAITTFNDSRTNLEPIEFRIGVNLGDIVVEGEDIFGDGVNIAARLEGRAPKGGILVSEAVHAQVKRKTGIAFTDAGDLSLKNIETPIRAWSWVGVVSVTGAPEEVSPAATEMPSIAVLPFTNLSGEPEQEVFADGLVEDIITTLSKLAGLRVIARNSSFVYKGRAVDIREAAKQLGVRYVLEGSVRKSANRIRMNVQLIDADNGSHVWAERYDRAIDDIFAVQDEITLVLATEMQVKLTEGDQARLHYTTTSNVDAWTHWVEGLAHYRNAVTKEDQAAALACWYRALELDPDSAALNAIIAFEHAGDARFGWWHDRATALVEAKSHARRALELDPKNADARIALGFALLVEGRYEEAADSVRKAVELAPGSADVANGACFMLASSGHSREAVPHGERAMRLSPVYPGQYLGVLGNAYRLSELTQEAIASFKAYHAHNEGFGLVDLVITYERAGQKEEARLAAQQLLHFRRNFTIASWAYSQCRADKAGLEEDIAALRAAGLPEN